MSRFPGKLFLIFTFVSSQMACVSNGDASLRTKICEIEQDVPSEYLGLYSFSAPKFLPSQNNYMTMEKFTMEISADDQGVFAAIPRRVFTNFETNPDKFPFNGKLKICTIGGNSYVQTPNPDGTYGVARIEYGTQNSQRTITLAPLTFDPEAIKEYNRKNFHRPIPFAILPSFSIDESKQGEIHIDVGEHQMRMVVDNRNFVTLEDKAELLKHAIPSNMGVWLFVQQPSMMRTHKADSLLKLRL